MLIQVSNFYERYEKLGLKVTLVLVSLQIIHLYWLATFVIFDAPQYTLGIPPLIFVVIDYLEVPALISGIVFYSLSLHFHKNKRDILFVGLLATQLVHIIWITDTFVYMSFKFNEMVYLAWFAILIDFLEVGVLYDLFKKLYTGRQAKVSNHTDLPLR